MCDDFLRFRPERLSIPLPRTPRARIPRLWGRRKSGRHWTTHDHGNRFAVHVGWHWPSTPDVSRIHFQDSGTSTILGDKLHSRARCRSSLFGPPSTDQSYQTVSRTLVEQVTRTTGDADKGPLGRAYGGRRSLDSEPIHSGSGLVAGSLCNSRRHNSTRCMATR